MDQVAYAVHNQAESEQLKAWLGLTHEDWVVDRVTARCILPGNKQVVNIAKLEFCEALGMQFEIIRYVSGESWLSKHAGQRSPFQSHIGLHLNEGEVFPKMDGCQLVQEAWTISHTNEFLVRSGRRYHYKIFEISPSNYIKFIRRL